MERKYMTDVVLLSVTEIEYAAAKELYDWKTVELGDIAYETAAFTRDGVLHSIALFHIEEYGMVASAASTMRIIYELRPRYVIMVGTCAGIAKSDVEEQIVGDIVIPDIVWNYTAGSFVVPEKATITYGDVGFIPYVEKLCTSEEMLTYVREAMSSPDNDCHVHIGPMACGTAVVATNKIMQNQIYTQMADTAGLEMESYGVYFSCKNCGAPRPDPVIIKSVCDYANDDKDKRFQRLGAYTSCQFAKFFLERFLPLPGDSAM